MNRARPLLYILLAVVASSAAVLSFSALKDLALVCGFSPQLSWLLPIVVDAGAAAGSVAWLAPWTPATARRYGRALAVGLLATSVAGNALGHALDAYRLAPAWWVVVAVSALAPAVLGAVVHLVVQMGRGAPVTQSEPVEIPAAEPEREAPVELAPVPRLHVARAAVAVSTINATPTPPAGIEIVEDEPQTVEEMVAAGWGRSRIANAAGISASQARTILKRERA